MQSITICLSLCVNLLYNKINYSYQINVYRKLYHETIHKLNEYFNYICLNCRFTQIFLVFWGASKFVGGPVSFQIYCPPGPLDPQRHKPNRNVKASVNDSRNNTHVLYLTVNGEEFFYSEGFKETTCQTV